MTIPTIQELYTKTFNNIVSNLGGSSSITGKLVIRAISYAVAGVVYVLYLALAKVQKNLWCDTADSENDGGTLERFGRVRLNRGPFAAVTGEYTVTVTGTDGGVIQTTANSTVQMKSTENSSAPNYLFDIITGATIAGGTATITVLATTPGTDSRLEVADELKFTAPIANVDSEGTVATISTTPAEAETIEAYRQKVVESYQIEPNGGAASDFRIWATDVPGIRQVYSYCPQPSLVDVYAEAELASSTDGKGTPSQSMLDDLADVFEIDPDTSKSLNERGRRPMGVWEIRTLPIIPLDVEVTLIGLTNTSSAVTTAITDAITAYLETIRPFVAGADDPNSKNNILFEPALSTIVTQAIPSTVKFDELQVTVDSVLYQKYEFVSAQIPYFSGLVTA